MASERNPVTIEEFEARAREQMATDRVDQQSLRLAAAYKNAAPSLSNLDRHETALVRKLTTVMHELKHRQAQRRTTPPLSA